MFECFVPEQSYRAHPEVIWLTTILPDPINTSLQPYRAGIVDEVNGTKIRTLEDLAKAFAEALAKAEAERALLAGGLSAELGTKSAELEAARRGITILEREYAAAENGRAA